MRGGFGSATAGLIPDHIPDGAVVELRLVPSTEAARDTVGMTQILDHTFVREGITVRR